MKLCGLAMVRNEADIIEAFARHNLQFLDELFVVMHAPNDETPQILLKLAGEGLKLHLFRNDELGFRKAEIMNTLARSILRDSGADFLFLLDADEFLKTASRTVLEASLASVPDDAIVAMKWASYIPMPDDPVEETNPVARIRRRRAREAAPVLKVAIGRSFAASGDLLIGEGNHCVVRPWGSRDQPVRHAVLADVALAHYPVRTEEQIFSKALIGIWSRWLHQRKVDKEMTLSSHWLFLYQRFVEGDALPAGKLTELAFHYSTSSDKVDDMVDPAQEDSASIGKQLVFDPLPVDYTLRYPQTARSSLMTVSRWVEQLISAQALANRPASSPVTRP